MMFFLALLTSSAMAADATPNGSWDCTVHEAFTLATAASLDCGAGNGNLNDHEMCEAYAGLRKFTYEGKDDKAKYQHCAYQGEPNERVNPVQAHLPGGHKTKRVCVPCQCKQSHEADCPRTPPSLSPTFTPSFTPTFTPTSVPVADPTPLPTTSAPEPVQTSSPTISPTDSPTAALCNQAQFGQIAGAVQYIAGRAANRGNEPHILKAMQKCQTLIAAMPTQTSPISFAEYCECLSGIDKPIALPFHCRISPFDPYPANTMVYLCHSHHPLTAPAPATPVPGTVPPTDPETDCNRKASALSCKTHGCTWNPTTTVCSEAAPPTANPTTAEPKTPVPVVAPTPEPETVYPSSPPTAPKTAHPSVSPTAPVTATIPLCNQAQFGQIYGAVQYIAGRAANRGNEPHILKAMQKCQALIAGMKTQTAPIPFAEYCQCLSGIDLVIAHPFKCRISPFDPFAANTMVYKCHSQHPLSPITASPTAPKTSNPSASPTAPKTSNPSASPTFPGCKAHFTRTLCRAHSCRWTDTVEHGYYCVVAGATCSDYDGDKKGCKKAGKDTEGKMCGYGNNHKCKGFSCADFSNNEFKCPKKGKKIGLTCYWNANGGFQKCGTETNAGIACSTYTSKKSCKKTGKLAKCKYEKHAKKCYGPSDPKPEPTCADQRNKKKCNAKEGCLYVGQIKKCVDKPQIVEGRPYGKLSAHSCSGTDWA